MPTGPMAWETATSGWTPEWREWWKWMMETDWADDTTIQHQCGPEYLMYLDIETFGAGTAKGVWP